MNQLWRSRKTLLCSAALLVLATMLASCTSNKPPVGRWVGLSEAPEWTVSHWKHNGVPGKTMKTPNYRIHTTMRPSSTRDKLTLVMEGAYERYREVTPGVAASDKPMDCFIFGTRAEWELFTKQRTGARAPTYLAISRGAYALNDVYIAYDLRQEFATLSVASHEGWHQYSSRHFKGRLPPALEEGMATLFEHIQWKDDKPQWNISLNPMQVQRLRRTLERRKMYPLEKLISIDAGHVVELPYDRVEAFYSQAWLLAKFFREYDNGRFRPKFNRMLRDVANGTVYDPSRTHQRNWGPWAPAAVKPMLEHYFGPLDELEKRYLKYADYVAYDEFKAHWLK